MTSLSGYPEWLSARMARDRTVRMWWRQTAICTRPRRPTSPVAMSVSTAHLDLPDDCELLSITRDGLMVWMFYPEATPSPRAWTISNPLSGVYGRVCNAVVHAGHYGYSIIKTFACPSIFICCSIEKERHLQPLRFLGSKCTVNAFTAGALPLTPLGELTAALPQTCYSCIWGDRFAAVMKKEGRRGKGEGRGMQERRMEGPPAVSPHHKSKILYSSLGMTPTSRIRAQEPFTISEVAVEWHEPMIPHLRLTNAFSKQYRTLSK